MRKLIEDLISAMEYHVEQTRPIHTTTIALQAAREALKSLSAQPAPVQPVVMTERRINDLIVEYATKIKSVAELCTFVDYDTEIGRTPEHWKASILVLGAVKYVLANTPPAAQPAPVHELQRYSPDGEGGMEIDSLGAYVKHWDVTTSPAQPDVPEGWNLEIVDTEFCDVRLTSPDGVAWRFRDTDGSDHFVWKFLTAMLTTPPAAQRQWVEVEQIKLDGDKLVAKHKEKNT
jgi:hypothetical protein